MKTAIIGLSLFLLSVSANADSNVPTVANDFVFTFFNADAKKDNGVLLLAIVSNNNNGTASVTVTSPYQGFSTIHVTVAPYSIFKIPIKPVSIEDQHDGAGTGEIVIENKGIRLQSTLPVAVYAHAEIYAGTSADTFLVIPAVHLGSQYVAVTSSFPNGIMNMIAIVAYQDNTQVTIGRQTVTLNALQVASVASKSFLSGTTISGNKPFGAISGNTCGETIGYCDYEAVMLLPVGAWGTQFAAIPFMFLTTNLYQVVANTDNTVVMAGNTQVATLNAGQYRRFSSGAALITANYPIQLIQLGQNAGGAANNLGDPFFLQLPSTDKMSNTSVLFQPTGFIEHDGVHFDFFLRIVTNTAGTGTIQLDGVTINALQFKRVPNSAFYYYEARALNTTHNIQTTHFGTQFSVISYSYGQYEGCGFACAFSLPVENPAATTTSTAAQTTTQPMRTTPGGGRCPANWSYLSSTNSCYQVFRQQVIWYVADEHCLSLNAGQHLTSIHTQAENDFIVSLAQQVLSITDSQYTWIGLNDIANFNEFKWSDRTSYDYQNWGAGEPIQQDGAENCGVLTVSPKCSQDPAVGKWKDIPCGAGNVTSFVCKIPSNQIIWQ